MFTFVLNYAHMVPHLSMEMPLIVHLLLGFVQLLFIFGGVFFLLWYYLKQSHKGIPETKPSGGQKIILPLRLQAYERFVLFLERISPSNLILRLNTPDITVSQLQSLLVRTIRDEYEYNLSQQLYISGHAWELIRNANEEMIALINRAALKAGNEALAGDFVKTVFELAFEKGKLPSELALDEIKKEMQKYF